MLKNLEKLALNENNLTDLPGNIMNLSWMFWDLVYLRHLLVLTDNIDHHVRQVLIDMSANTWSTGCLTLVCLSTGTHVRWYMHLVNYCHYVTDTWVILYQHLAHNLSSLVVTTVGSIFSFERDFLWPSCNLNLSSGQHSSMWKTFFSFVYLFSLKYKLAVV